MGRSRIDSRAQKSTDIKVFRCSHVAVRYTFVDLPRAILGFPRRQTYRLREMCRSRIDSRAQKSTYIKVFRCSQIAGRYMPRKGAKLQLCCTLGGGLFPPCSGVTGVGVRVGGDCSGGGEMARWRVWFSRVSRRKTQGHGALHAPSSRSLEHATRDFMAFRMGTQARVEQLQWRAMAHSSNNKIGWGWDFSAEHRVLETNSDLPQGH